MGRKARKIYEPEPGILEKACVGCGEQKSLSSFNKEPHHSGGHVNLCKTCCSERYFEKYKERQSNNIRRKKYGIEPEEFQRLLSSQNGKCAICGRLMTRPHVDHDHGKGLVRGLLCYHCNYGIGLLGDDAQRLLDAAAYLKR